MMKEHIPHNPRNLQQNKAPTQGVFPAKQINIPMPHPHLKNKGFQTKGKSTTFLKKSDDS